MRTDDDLVDVAAGKDAECALMQVHDGQVGTPPLHDVIVRVQAHQQEVTLCPRQLRTHTSALSRKNALLRCLLTQDWFTQDSTLHCVQRS